jgi:multidrug efflux pump subunit AcrA (membrane-fusion protein)
MSEGGVVNLITQRFLRIFVLLGMVLLPVLSTCGSQTADVAVTPTPALSRPDNVSAEGVVTPFRSVDLSFEGSGRVDKILVAEGDQVVAGQELAVLETRDLEQSVLQAEARLESAEAQLAKARAGARPEELAEAQVGLTVAQSAVGVASEAVTIAKSRVAEAQANQQVTQEAIQISESQLAAAQAAYEAAQAAYNKLKNQPTEREVKIAEQQVEAAANTLWETQLLWKVGEAYEGEPEANEVMVDLAELELARVKAGARPEDIAEAKGLMEQAQANIKVAEAQVAKARVQAVQAEAGGQVAQAGVMQAQAQEDKVEAQALQAEAQLDLASAGSRMEDIAAAQAQVKQAEASLAEAENALEDAVLKAPFDGTVGAILIDEGDLVGPQLTAVQFGDLSRLRVETKDLSEIDVAMVEVGQPATITVDALEGRELSATVATISPVGTEERGDTVYQVTLDLDPEAGEGLRWGMSTFTEIETGRDTPSTGEDTAQVEVSGDAVVSAQAVIVPHKSADLSFKSAGRVQEILVAEGDFVTAGQPLVKQETRNLDLIVLQAEAGLAQAEANLAKIKAGARSQEIASAEAAVSIAKANLSAAEAAVLVAEGQLAVAQAKAEAAAADSSMAEAQIAVMQGAWSAADARFQKAENGATPIEVEIAELQVSSAEAELQILELLRTQARGYIKGHIAAYRNQVEIARLMLEDVREGTKGDDLVAAQADATRAWSDVLAAQAQFSQAQAQELVAQAGVQTAQAQVSQARAEEEMAKGQVQQAQAELDTLKAGSRQEDITAAEAEVAAATAALAAAKNALEDTTLRALFDGTVGAISVDEGQLVQPAELVVRLGDLSLLRAETDDLSEVDVGRIQVGQRAAVTVDALDGKVLPGTVSRIAPVATERRGDIVYKISLDLDASPGTGLRWGMSAFVEIDTATQAGALAPAGLAQAGAARQKAG